MVYAVFESFKVTRSLL